MTGSRWQEKKDRADAIYAKHDFREHPLRTTVKALERAAVRLEWIVEVYAEDIGRDGLHHWLSVLRSDLGHLKALHEGRCPVCHVAAEEQGSAHAEGCPEVIPVAG